MKTVHNVRVRVHSGERSVVDAVLARADAMARRSDEDRIEKNVTSEDGIVIGELWIDRQQPVRRFVDTLVAAMNSEDKARIRSEPHKFLDTGTHCFLLLDRAAFLEERIVLTRDPNGSVNVRLNIACWPANRENAEKTLQEIFA